jgi:MFS family permease
VNLSTFINYLNNLLAIPPGTEALSIIGFIASFGESSITSWANTYYTRSLDSSSFTQGFGFIAFMISMATGRFLCDRLRMRFGRNRIFFVAGFLASVGLAIAISSPSLSKIIDQKSNSFEIAIATIGFAMTGLGLSTLIPTCFSSAGNLQGVHPGSSIAIVAMFTYSGSIVAPYILGLISDAFNSDLRIAFLADAILLILITPLSFYVPPETFSNQSSNPAIKTQLLSMDDRE